MKKIVTLIKKDILFNLKMYVGIFVAALCLMSAAALGIDGSEATSTLNYLVYTCCASIIIVPFSYNIEDDFSTRKFIFSLPVSTNQILSAKLMLSAVASGVISCSAVLLFNVLGQAVLFRCALIPIMFSIVMSVFFIMAFYKWDINIARLVAVTPIVLFAFSAKMVVQLNVAGELFSLKALLIIFIIVIVFAALMKKVTLEMIK